MNLPHTNALRISPFILPIVFSCISYFSGLVNAHAQFRVESPSTSKSDLLICNAENMENYGFFSIQNEPLIYSENERKTSNFFLLPKIKIEIFSCKNDIFSKDEELQNPDAPLESRIVWPQWMHDNGTPQYSTSSISVQRAIDKHHQKALSSTVYSSGTSIHSYIAALNNLGRALRVLLYNKGCQFSKVSMLVFSDNLEDRNVSNLLNRDEDWHVIFSENSANPNLDLSFLKSPFLINSQRKFLPPDQYKIHLKFERSSRYSSENSHLEKSIFWSLSSLTKGSTSTRSLSPFNAPTIIIGTPKSPMNILLTNPSSKSLSLEERGLLDILLLDQSQTYQNAFPFCKIHNIQIEDQAISNQIL